MKRYIFKSGKRIEAENLNGEAIKEYESTLGELVGVISEGKYVPVWKDIQTIFYNGESHTFKEWAEITGINERTLRDRYYRGDRDHFLFREVKA